MHPKVQLWDFYSRAKISFFFHFCYIFRDLLTFYSLIVGFCNIFSWTFYCSVYIPLSAAAVVDTHHCPGVNVYGCCCLSVDFCWQKRIEHVQPIKWQNSYPMRWQNPVSINQSEAKKKRTNQKTEYKKKQPINSIYLFLVWKDKFIQTKTIPTLKLVEICKDIRNNPLYIHLGKVCYRKWRVRKWRKSHDRKWR
jgi:hypothetical protein